MAELLTLPPDSKRIRARETLPVTTGDGDRLRMDWGVALVELPLVGVYNGLKGLLVTVGWLLVLIRFSTSSSNFLVSNNFLA